jgi:hypothetical protein
MVMDPNPEDKQIVEMLESYADENPSLITEKKHQDTSKPELKNAFSATDETLQAAQKKLSAEEQELYLKKLVEEERRRYDFLMIRNMKLKVKKIPPNPKGRAPGSLGADRLSKLQRARARKLRLRNRA